MMRIDMQIIVIGVLHRTLVTFVFVYLILYPRVFHNLVD